MDTMLRLDRTIADLITFLDQQVGAGNYTLVLSADHGSTPIPEQLQLTKRDLGAGRLDVAAINKAVEAALTATFGAPADGTYWALRDAMGYRLRKETLAERKIDPARAAEVVRQTLLLQPQIAAAFTRAELLASPPRSDSVIDAVRRSYNAARSQDVMFVVRPYVIDRRPAGTTHGTPYDFDNHVPLIWYGAGIPKGTRRDRVGAEQVAPTLAGLLQIPRPPQAQGDRLF
jgi:arylsulfatase A-like enzyme